LRKATQPARTSANQTNVKSAGRQTIAITTPLNMAHIQSRTSLSNISLHETATRIGRLAFTMNSIPADEVSGLELAVPASTFWIAIAVHDGPAQAGALEAAPLEPLRDLP
jgi:hypothetical protein